MDKVYWVDLHDTEKMISSLVSELNESPLAVENKISTLIDWGQVHRACMLILKLNTTEEGRFILRKNFWASFVRLFALGEARAIETILHHEFVDIKEEMTKDHLYLLYQAIVELQPLCLLERLLMDSTSYTNRIKPCEVNWPKVHVYPRD